jgi:hypothetical protein
MKRILTTAAAAMTLTLAPTAVASAQPVGGQVLQADITPQNGSGASATATVTIDGDEMTVRIEGRGFTPGGSPHAQHIHGVLGQDSFCPTGAQDADGDGIVTTSEGASTYGPILVSLTTGGDMGADTSGLAVDRMPVADAAGNLSYLRTFAIPASVGDDVDALHIVQHGVDFDASGAYDGDRASDLDPSLPAEATDPASCGELVAMPSGGVQTGGGGMVHDHGAGSSSSGSGAGSGVSTGMAVLGLGGAAALATSARFGLHRTAR